MNDTVVFFDPQEITRVYSNAGLNGLEEAVGNGKLFWSDDFQDELFRTASREQLSDFRTLREFLRAEGRLEFFGDRATIDDRIALITTPSKVDRIGTEANYDPTTSKEVADVSFLKYIKEKFERGEILPSTRLITSDGDISASVLVRENGVVRELVNLENLDGVFHIKQTGDGRILELIKNHKLDPEIVESLRGHFGNQALPSGPDYQIGWDQANVKSGFGTAALLNGLAGVALLGFVASLVLTSSVTTAHANGRDVPTIDDQFEAAQELGLPVTKEELRSLLSDAAAEGAISAIPVVGQIYAVVGLLEAAENGPELVQFVKSLLSRTADLTTETPQVSSQIRALESIVGLLQTPTGEVVVDGIAYGAGAINSVLSLLTLTVDEAFAPDLLNAREANTAAEIAYAAAAPELQARYEAVANTLGASSFAEAYDKPKIVLFGSLINALANESAIPSGVWEQLNGRSQDEFLRVAIDFRFGSNLSDEEKEEFGRGVDNWAEEIGGAQGQRLASLFESCFLAGTEVSLSDGVRKPIEEIVVGDEILAFDPKAKDGLGTLVPRRVTETYVNSVTTVLDFHGTGITPGHVTLCGAGKYAGQCVPIIDILTSDGAIAKADGSLVRAATNVVVGSEDDQFIPVAYCTDPDALNANNWDIGQLRLGTCILKPDGSTTIIRKMIEGAGMTLLDNGLVSTAEGAEEPLRWFGELPRPEQYVLAKSGLTMADIVGDPHAEEHATLQRRAYGEAVH